MALLIKDEETGIVRPWFDPGKEVMEAQFKLLNSIYFLIKQGDVFGERLPCVKCGGRHDYITLNCIERPFSGLTRGLYAYCQAIKDHGLTRFMSPEEKARYVGVKNMLNKMPDLGNVHPSLARDLVKDIGPTDMQVGAYALGILEGISETTARKLIEKINDRGLKPKLVLEVPNPFDKYMWERRRAA